MFSINEVVASNNSGVDHLLHYKYTEAISLFQTSLQHAKHHLQSQSRSNQSLPGKQGAFQCDFIDLDCSSHLVGCSENFSEREYSFVSKNAMAISTMDKNQQGVGNCSIARLLPMVTISAVYNLAIAHHLIAIHYQSPHHLRKALHFYEISYRMQRHEPLCHSPMHLMCVLNNVAMIHRSMNHEQKSNKFLQRLHSMMSILKDAGLNQSYGQHWNGFWGNVLGLLVDPPSTAAAA